MRLQNCLTFLLVVGPSICVADDSASIFAGMSTRSDCVEHLKGLGSASIIFDAPTNGDITQNSAANGEMSWDAQLVTESGQIVRVQLHCARSKSPIQQDKGITGPSQSFVSELVRH